MARVCVDPRITKFENIAIAMLESGIMVVGKWYSLALCKDRERSRVTPGMTSQKK